MAIAAAAAAANGNKRASGQQEVLDIGAALTSKLSQLITIFTPSSDEQWQILIPILSTCIAVNVPFSA